jgi:DNA-binding FadR family transcriptional regulator
MRVIRDRNIEPGQRLPTEAAFCAILGISRPALREALSALETLGAVAVRKGSGRVLMPLNFGALLGNLGGLFTLRESRVLDLLAVRQVLEVNILPAAMLKCSAANLAELGRVVDTMETLARNGQHFAAQDRRFHGLLYLDFGNETLTGLLDLFWQLFCAIDPNVLAHKERLEETADHHRRILTALRAGDIRKAQYHLETHFYDIAYALSSHDRQKPVAARDAATPTAA